MTASKRVITAQPTSAVPDPHAGREFRLAVVRLNEQEPETDALVDASAEAARLLLTLAVSGSADELRRLLNPDPGNTDVKWTVARFGTGDLTPIETRTFDDPVEALATVADCSDDTHAAAELVASTAEGLQWTAIARTHERVLFQLPGLDSMGDVSADAPADVAAAALRRWRKRLADWSAHSGSERDVEVIAQLEPIAPTPTASTFASDKRFAALENRLAGIEEKISGLALAIETFTLAVQDRDVDVERRLSARVENVEEQVIALRLAFDSEVDIREVDETEMPKPRWKHLVE